MSRGGEAEKQQTDLKDKCLECLGEFSFSPVVSDTSENINATCWYFFAIYIYTHTHTHIYIYIYMYIYIYTHINRECHEVLYGYIKSYHMRP